jgi:transcriptional regulator with GAF, ATPase, and Fis domain
VLCDGREVIEAAHLAALDAAPPPSPTRATLKDDLSRLEHDRIVRALDEAAGNQTRAAKLLGISRHALIDRIERHGIARPRKRGR